MNFYRLEEIESKAKIADVIEFDDGQTIIKAIGTFKSLIVYNNIEEFEKNYLKVGITLKKINFINFEVIERIYDI